MREAQGSRERTGERLLEFLKRRLDNVVYRLGLAPPAPRPAVRQPRPRARQRAARDDPLLPRGRGRRRRLAASSPVRPTAAEAVELLGRVVPWLESDPDALAGRVLRYPAREDINSPIDEGLVVEHFSRR